MLTCQNDLHSLNTTHFFHSGHHAFALNYFIPQGRRSLPPDSRHSTLMRSLFDESSDNIPPIAPARTKATSPGAENRTKSLSPSRSFSSQPLPSPSFAHSSAHVATPKIQGVFMSAPRYPSHIVIVADEFSSQGSDRDYQTAVTQDTTDSGTKDGVYYAQPLPSASTIGRCKALYDYEANMYDELSIRTGWCIHLSFEE